MEIILERVGSEYALECIKIEKQTDLEEAACLDPKKVAQQAAEIAKEAQPTGFTLSTSKVKTTVPFLIKHRLRFLICFF